MKIIHHKKITSLAIALGMCLAFVSYTQPAQGRTFKEGFEDVKKFGTAEHIDVPPSVNVFVLKILNIILTFLAILALIVLLYAAFLMITHMGEEDTVKKAKNIIKYVVIGLILIGISAIIVNVVINIVILGKPDSV